jgi:hypothetical protein
MMRFTGDHNVIGDGRVSTVQMADTILEKLK